MLTGNLAEYTPMRVEPERPQKEKMASIRWWKLKERGTEIYFEKENIWTLDAKGEVLITIMRSLVRSICR